MSERCTLLACEEIVLFEVFGAVSGWDWADLRSVGGAFLPRTQVVSRSDACVPEGGVTLHICTVRGEPALQTIDGINKQIQFETQLFFLLFTLKIALRVCNEVWCWFLLCVL